MLNKKAKGKRCWVTFSLRTDGEEAYLVGEWNNWQPEKMRRRKDGTFWLTKQFEAGKSYRFRYLVDGHQWFNDFEADGYCPNPYGSEDCIVRT
ncbi:isoamylase early set domain-containing protein [Thermosulfurimonas dismutans]|uniref:1,4-alpha-glucan branching enzyme n=1 Tax=Thermosulfurimonas dismutans TaxID=999894 RepID=A0A179D3R1_9BACT|nr:isoamylase early set domain-containing protein [Thermosulfurimonas dismutans]OAQ20112.1 1,4-alpha-glucan branching enzyme [Thermosulfurimonas dismutans]